MSRLALVLTDLALLIGAHQRLKMLNRGIPS